mgnify:CR=1 FL=1
MLGDILNPCPRFKQCPPFGLSWHPSDAEKWIKRGARYVPRSDDELRDVRRSLYELEPSAALRFMDLLSGATTQEVLLKLYNTPKFQKTLGLTQKRLKEKIAAFYERIRKPASLRVPRPVKPPQTVFEQVRPSIVQAKHMRVNRAELYENLWAAPTTHLAEEYGISDVAIGKICMTYKIPKPKRGYWARKQNGHKVKPRRLPKPDWNPEIRFTGYLGAPPIADDDARAKVLRLIELMSVPGFSVEVPKEQKKLHPVLAKAREAEMQEQEFDFENVPLVDHAPVKPGPRRLDYDTIIALHKRAWSILNTLLFFLELHGFAVCASEDRCRHNGLTATLFEQDVEFCFSRENRILRLDVYDCPPCMRSAWCDGKSRYLESYFAHFACTLAYIAGIKTGQH